MALSQGTLDAISEAHEFFSQSDVTRAKSVLDQAIQQSQHDDDDLFDSCCMRASIAAMEGDTSGAIVKTLEAIGDSSSKYLVRSYLEGVSALSRGVVRTAKLKFEETLRADDTFVLAHLGLASVAYHQKDYQGSFRFFRRVLGALGDQAPPIVRVGMAICSHRLGNNAHAMLCVQRALALNAEDALAKLVLVVLLIEARNIRQLVTTVGELKRLVPNNVTVIQKIADLAYFKASAERAVRARGASLRVLALSVLPHANDTQAAYAQFQAGRVSHATGDLVEAKASLLQALETLPDLVAAAIHLCKVLYKLGEKDVALQRLEQLDRKYTSEREVLEMLAVMAVENEHHEMAIEYTRRLVEMAPGEATSWSLAAWAHRLGKQTALSFLRRCAGLMELSGQTLPWQLRANIAALDDLASADLLENLISEQTEAMGPDAPELAPMLFNLTLQLEAQDVDKAMRGYTSLVRRFPGLREPYARLFHLSAERGWHKQSLGWLSLWNEVNSRDGLHIVYTAGALHELGRTSSAVALLRTNPRSTHSALALGSMYLHHAHAFTRKATRNLMFARDRFEYALKKDPANLLAAHGLAACAGVLSLAPQTQIALDRIRELPPNDPYVVDGMTAHVANVLVACDSFRPAIDALSNIDPKTAGQYSALAFCYVGVHNFESAILAIEEGLVRFPGHPPMVYNAALVYCAAVMHALLPQNATYLSNDATVKLREWLVNGLKHAHAFTMTKPPPSFESGSAAQQFVSHVAMHAFGLRERIARLHLVGKVETHRATRDAEAWRLKFAERQEELAAVEREKLVKAQSDELYLAETYASLQERMENLRHENPVMPPEYRGDMVYPDDAYMDLEGEGDDKRPRVDDMVTVDDLRDLDMSPTLAVGGLDSQRGDGGASAQQPEAAGDI